MFENDDFYKKMLSSYYFNMDNNMFMDFNGDIRARGTKKRIYNTLIPVDNTEYRDTIKKLIVDEIYSTFQNIEGSLGGDLLFNEYDPLQLEDTFNREGVRVSYQGYLTCDRPEYRLSSLAPKFFSDIQQLSAYQRNTLGDFLIVMKSAFLNYFEQIGKELDHANGVFSIKLELEVPYLFTSEADTRLDDIEYENKHSLVVEVLLPFDATNNLSKPAIYDHIKKLIEDHNIVDDIIANVTIDTDEPLYTLNQPISEILRADSDNTIFLHSNDSTILQCRYRTDNSYCDFINDMLELTDRDEFVLLNEDYSILRLEFYMHNEQSYKVADKFKDQLLVNQSNIMFSSNELFIKINSTHEINQIKKFLKLIRLECDTTLYLGRALLDETANKSTSKRV